MLHYLADVVLGARQNQSSIALLKIPIPQLPRRGSDLQAGIEGSDLSHMNEALPTHK